jgi:hypothetical protein
METTQSRYFPEVMYKTKRSEMQALIFRVMAMTSIVIHSTGAFNGLNVDLTCQACNASFYCTAGNRFQCPMNSLAVSWPVSQITGCTCNDGFEATPERDGCFTGETPFYYEDGEAKSCPGGLRQTIYQQADSAYDCVCPPGYYGLPGSGACTRCAPGSYAEFFNTSECTLCPVFAFSEEGSFC